ncbi:MAG: glycoside hydrolase family 31 protein [Clostridia bacterium]|nr:glycoside hydrolase family 31 protein [Clostridia bacterium]
MKKKKIVLLMAAVLSILMLIPAFMVPSIAAETSTTYINQTFDNITLGKQGTAMSTQFPGSTVPSSATIVTNPTGTDNVMQMTLAPVATGDVGYDFIIIDRYTYQITWADESTKASGTATRGSTSYTVTSTDGGATVTVSGKTGSFTVSRDAAKKAATDGDANIDKNLCPNVLKDLDYASFDKVVLQAEYYIPTGAKGSVESQQIQYKYTAEGTTEETSASFLNYFRIDCESGLLTTGHIYSEESYDAIYLDKDVWNTISIVINLDTGAAELYVNNILRFSGRFVVGDVNLTNMTLLKKTWNIAKINRVADGDESTYAGCFYINSAIMQTYISSMNATVADSDDLMFRELTLRSGRKVGAAAGQTVLMNTDVTASDVLLSSYADVIAPVQGASIRLTNTSGIRFATQLSTSRLNELVAMKNDGKIKNVEIGTLITPYTYVVEAGNFTVDALSKLSYSAKYLDVKAKIGAYFNDHGLTLDEGYNTTFVGSIIDVRPANRDRLFTGVGYVRLTLNDGSVKYIYSYDYTDASTQESKYSRSIQYIASVFVNNSAFADYKELLQSFMNGMTVMDVSSSYIKNVQYSYNEFFFQNAAGIACQLVYDGNNGWRLQATTPTQTNSAYNEFDNVGAAQALSLYLGEEYDDVTEKLTVTSNSSTITIKAANTDTYVTLNKTGSFNLKFYSGDGTLMNNVTSITDDGSSIVMKGDLLTGEAIYGGGERFDGANKRGKSLKLYSYDAYNAGGTDRIGTYTAVPLFTSSRGSGMFFNRFEVMTADFGKTSSNQWSLTIDNDLIDCYFYSTGKMTDAIKGYTDLSGHASLPEEWAQGVLICRYSPDLGTLDGETMSYSQLTDIPDYETLTMSDGGQLATEWAKSNSWTTGTYLFNGSSRKYMYYNGAFVRVTSKGNPSGAGVKYIVESLTAAGMKPTAMVMEGMNWTGITYNDANYQNFVEIVTWLEERDINVTVYMYTGGNLPSKMSGYKSEYMVTADVTYKLTYTNGQSTGGYTYSHQYTAGTETTDQIPKLWAENADTRLQTTSMKYLDVTNPEAMDWFLNTIWKQLIDLGIDGVKIDFCELMPNEGTYNIVGNKTNNSTGAVSKNVNVGTATISYNWYDPTVFESDEVHHAYPTYFISTFYQEMHEIAPEGFIVLNRGGGIGMQRNPYIWGGDQVRNETNLTTQLMAVINSGISGIPFVTYDMAGYCYSETGGYWGGSNDSFAASSTVKAEESKLFIRAIQYTAFSTMIQTHGDVRHMYELSSEAQSISKTYTQIHDDLLPYIQKYSKIACDTGIPVLRHLVLHYQDDANVYSIDNQYMLGDALMVAPILTLDTTSRSVYLPEGNWVDLLTGTKYTVGSSGKTLTVSASTKQIPVFLNLDSSDAADLVNNVFNQSAWQSVNGKKKITVPNMSDNYGDDIFFTAE